MDKKSGFTLAEIVIVMVIIGILATLGVPRLTQSREAAMLGEAVQVLSAYRGAQDRWFLDHSAYTADCTNLDVIVTLRNYDNLQCVGGNGAGANDGNVSIRRIGGAYTITVTRANVFSCAGCNAYLTRHLP